MNDPLNPPPMGIPSDASRTCSRLLDIGDSGEILCGKPATVHIIYWWDPEPLNGPGSGFDHGFACPEHWADYQRRWNDAAHHDINHACGMPGSRIHPEKPCWFEDLPVAEPVRAVAKAVALEEVEPS